MFFKSTLLVVAAATLSVTAAVVTRSFPPAGWWTDGLEPYDAYHGRYVSLDCVSKHNSSFFDSCCHPLLKNEPLSTRPDKCDPSKANDCGDNNKNDDRCNGSKTKANPALPKNAAPKPKKQPPPASDDADDDDDDDSRSKPSNVLATGSGGIATYFFQNGVAGACGAVHPDTSRVVALDFRTYSSGGNCGNSKLCGKTIHITNKKNGKSVDAIVADCCPTCINKNSIDLSLGAFKALAPLGDGIFDVEWKIVG